MMYYPTFKPFSNTNILKTDIQEKDGKYLFNMEAPGIKKEDIQIELSQGYLKVTATKQGHNESNGRIVRKERYVGTSSRSFYIGDEYKEEDIKASFDNGELKITLPTEVKKEEEAKQTIRID